MLFRSAAKKPVHRPRGRTCMATTWIVAADSSRARFLQLAGREPLVELDSLLNPEARIDNRELTTYAQEHATDLFAKRVCDYLDKARNDHRYDKLVLVAPPKFLGTLRRSLDKEVAKRVVGEMPKDLSWLKERELERYFSKRG